MKLKFFIKPKFFNAGLFFIADVKDELIQKFEAILNFLGDEGLGADKTIGKGLFEAEEIPDFNLNFNETENKSNFYYSLSLYSPTKEEFEKIAPDESYYDFIIRDGLVSNKTL
jgi:CRISPR-associated protein Csm4